jgi:hypothetical protein
MGKTSVWLSDELDARWRVTGFPLSEIIRRGLDAIDGTPDLETVLDAVVRRAIREEGSHAPVAAYSSPARYEADEYSSEPYVPDP